VREWLKGLEPEDRKAIGEDIKDVEFSWPNCSGYFLHRAGEHGSASRLYQEDPEDTAT
jgi:hypothetical protein